MKKLLLAIAFVFIGVNSFGQTVINPTGVTFEPSSDHDATVAGTAVVSSYEFRVYAKGATAPMTTVSLGKPTPVNNLVTVTNSATLIGLPIGEYFARVAAIGPGGAAESLDSNPFGRIRPPSVPKTVTLKP